MSNMLENQVKALVARHFGISPSKVRLDDSFLADLERLPSFSHRQLMNSPSPRRRSVAICVGCSAANVTAAVRPGKATLTKCQRIWYDLVKDKGGLDE